MADRKSETTQTPDMESAPRGMRVRIAVLGRRNAGKSSLLNAIAGQDVALVSEIPGTTTDPVEKPMEFLPLGPVIFIDTAGTDDTGELGEMRVDRTMRALDSADAAIVACECGAWGGDEDAVCAELVKRGIPFCIALTKADLHPDQATGVVEVPPCRGAVATVAVSATERAALEELHDAIVSTIPESLLEDPPILADLMGERGLAVLVVPVDKQAPKGRLILPQVQTIRDLLDDHCMCMVVQDVDLPLALSRLADPPDIVVTDSQAFASVARDVPQSIPMTSFSILFARFKGDLATLAHGAGALNSLRDGSRVLIAESCTHHRICDDIGSIKIPALLHNKIAQGIEIANCRGTDFPQDLSEYNLVIHCGGCMLNRTAMLSRIDRCTRSGVPITNYGMSIAHALGILPRALAPFEGALDAYMEGAGRQD